MTINPDDFSEVEIVDNGTSSFTTDSITLKDLIDHTSYACATDMARPIFTGTHIDVTGTTLNMVATDTHRLALKSAELAQPVEQPFKAVIPSRLLMEIARQLPTDMPQDVQIVALRNFMTVRFGNIFIRTRLIEGEFPNYRRVIPTQFTSAVTLNRQEFTVAVERASIVAKDAQYNVINFAIQDDQISLTSQHPDYGTIEDSVPCQIEGESIRIAFNGKFVLDILKHCHSEEIVLRLKASSPMLVQDKDEQNCVFVVTPMRAK